MIEAHALVDNQSLNTLIILAAGNGSRFGGPKQFTPFGPKQQPLMLYNIELAAQAGYQHFIIVCQRKHHQLANDFCATNRHYNIKVVYQDNDVLPLSCALTFNTNKPLGTAHAIWCCHSLISSTFTVINGDDFYGCSAFKSSQQAHAEHPNHHLLLGYPVANTLSVNGGVNRGLCRINKEKELQSIEEITDIIKAENAITGLARDGLQMTFNHHDLVSMNFWTFQKEIFIDIEQLLIDKLSQRNNTFEECYLPDAVKLCLARENKAIKVVASHDSWFGVTYAADSQQVDQHLEQLNEKGFFANY